MLPDPFLFEDGHRVSTPEEWKARREEILRTAVEMEYGGMPPSPDEVWVEVLEERGINRANSYRAHCIIDGEDFTFCFMVYRPRVEGPCPAVITGDAVYTPDCDTPVIAEANRRGFAVVKFNRLEIAPYHMTDHAKKCGIFRFWKDRHFTTISAWAWGYLRVVDAILQFSYIHPEQIALTGHARGGMSVLLAGAVDERIRYVNPNGSGTHGCGCYRFLQQEDESLFPTTAPETLFRMCRAYREWMGDGVAEFVGREGEIPYDSHFIKALIAPRVFIETNAYGDIWVNPRGSYLSFLAAKEVWKLLGCEENCLTWYRNGGENHGLEEFSVLFDVMTANISQTPLPEDVRRTPYTDMEPLHDWGCPE